MEQIFRKELKADGSLADTSATEEADDTGPEPSQNKGATKWKRQSTVDTPQFFQCIYTEATYLKLLVKTFINVCNATMPLYDNNLWLLLF